jgi:hypothetical protein
VFLDDGYSYLISEWLSNRRKIKEKCRECVFFVPAHEETVPALAETVSALAENTLAFAETVLALAEMIPALVETEKAHAEKDTACGRVQCCDEVECCRPKNKKTPRKLIRGVEEQFSTQTKQSK